MAYGGAWDVSPQPLSSIYPYVEAWPTNSTHTWYQPARTLSDEDVDRIADRIIAKLEARGYRIDAMKSEEV